MTTPLANPSPPISPNLWKVVARVQADDLPVPVWESWQSGIEKRVVTLNISINVMTSISILFAISFVIATS